MRDVTTHARQRSFRAGSSYYTHKRGQNVYREHSEPSKARMNAEYMQPKYMQ